MNEGDESVVDRGDLVSLLVELVGCLIDIGGGVSQM